MNEPRPLLRITTPSAQELEGYLSIGTDLQYVMRVTHAAVGFMESGHEDDFTLPTYLSAALVAYARPFSDGVRGSKSLKLVATDVYADIEGALEFHAYLINQRSKLIAHSVNPFEDTHVGVVADSQGAPIGIGYLSTRLVSLVLDDYKQFNQLAKIALEATSRKITEVQELLWAEVKRYSSEELARLKPSCYTAPASAKAEQARSKS